MLEVHIIIIKRCNALQIPCII